jgi:hypothetical protein
MANQRRMIYAQLAENKGYALMSDKAQKVYVFLIVLADDDGRLKGDSEWLRIKIFPYNPEVLVSDMKGYIKEIVKTGLITWYKKNNDYFIEHPNWEKYQILRADRKKDSNLPPPDDNMQPNDNQMTTKRVRKLSKLSKRREVTNSPLYLKKIPEDDLDIFYNRFDCSKKAIISKGEDLAAWCETNGRVKKNYKTFLLVALKKDFPERREPVKKNISFSRLPDLEVTGVDTPEVQEKRKKTLDKMRKDLIKLGVL